MSLVPAFRGARKLERDRLVWHFPCYVGRAEPASAVREGDFKLIEFFEDGGRVERYDLRTHPSEERDLAASELLTAQALAGTLPEWQRRTRAAIPREVNPGYDPRAKRPQGSHGGIRRNHDADGPRGRDGRGKRRQAVRGRGQP